MVAASISGDARPANYEAVPRVTYTDLQAAAVGAVGSVNLIWPHDDGLIWPRESEVSRGGQGVVITARGGGDPPKEGGPEPQTMTARTPQPQRAGLRRTSADYNGNGQ